MTLQNPNIDGSTPVGTPVTYVNVPYYLSGGVIIGWNGTYYVTRTNRDGLSFDRRAVDLLIDVPEKTTFIIVPDPITSIPETPLPLPTPPTEIYIPEEEVVEITSNFFASEAMKMIVGDIPMDLRYDLNRNGIVDTGDVTLLQKGEPLIELEKEIIVPEPITSEPITPEPITPEPITPEPITPEPITPEPTTLEPITSQKSFFEKYILYIIIGIVILMFILGA